MELKGYVFTSPTSGRRYFYNTEKKLTKNTLNVVKAVWLHYETGCKNFDKDYAMEMVKQCTEKASLHIPHPIEDDPTCFIWTPDEGYIANKFDIEVFADPGYVICTIYGSYLMLNETEISKDCSEITRHRVI